MGTSFLEKFQICAFSVFFFLAHQAHASFHIFYISIIWVHVIFNCFMKLTPPLPFLAFSSLAPSIQPGCWPVFPLFVNGRKQEAPSFFAPSPHTHSLSVPTFARRRKEKLFLTFWKWHIRCAIKHFPGVFGEILLCYTFLDAFQADNSAVSRVELHFWLHLTPIRFPEKNFWWPSFPRNFRARFSPEKPEEKPVKICRKNRRIFGEFQGDKMHFSLILFEKEKSPFPSPLR